MIDTPRISERPAQEFAAVHIETPRSAIQQVMGPAISEVMAAVRAQNVGPVGPWFAHHLKITAATFDLDVCVPVSSPVSAVGRVRPDQRPALKVVSTVYRGPYEGLGQAWHEFEAWVQAHGLRVAADMYETYQVGPESSANPDDWRTEFSRALIS